MRGPKLFEHLDWKSKKIRCPVFTENIGIVMKKKKVYMSSDVLFSTKSIVEEKKRSLLFVMRPPIFSEALIGLSTCDMSNLRGLRTHGSCF